MISFLRGILAGKTTTAALIDVQGVGYEVFMSARDLSLLDNEGSEVLIYTSLMVREDDISLYGFLTNEEKELFYKLRSVSGIGPKMALAALSLYEPGKLMRFIAAQDVQAIQKIPGVGKKTASRIVLELKDSFKIVSTDTDTVYDNQQLEFNDTGAVIDTVYAALLAMGFSSQEAELALKGAKDDINESELLQYALKRLDS